MKRNLRILGIMVLVLMVILPMKAQTFTPPFVTYTPVFAVTERNLSQIVLDDGVYELSVYCQTHTGLNRNYTLDVRIQNDKVVRIYFGNGGSVHSGHNNSGYTWRGGGIRWNTDWEGDITGGEAVIHVDYGNGQWQLFTIRF